ncbi:MAG: FtsW/RodA/SpoVE family cell cycle protein [Planctomycetales bacterium]|nr:FtsW/RodA/SpoVE family cell cycle protein [Planctomycetales bacterium]
MESQRLGFRLPWGTILLFAALVGCGLLGISRSEELAGGSGRLLRVQFAWGLVAGVGAALATAPNYRRVLRLTYPIFFLSLVSLGVVYLFPAINGARRWIRLGPLGFQPSEFAKLAFVLAMSRYLMFRENYRKLSGLIAPLILALAPSLLILREPDLGTALLFFPLLLAMLAIAGARRRDLVLMVAACVLVAPVLWSQMSREQRSRVTAVWNQAEPGRIVQGDGYHLAKAKQLLVLGGVWGSAIEGETAFDQGVYHIPEGATDSIFVVIAERYGLFGATILLLLYALLIWQAVAIAEATREPFGRLVAGGIGALFAIQVLINAGMMVGLLPITGLSLPLVSYGGSGLLAHGLAIGLLLNIGLRPGYEVGREPFRFPTAPVRRAA